ncbi:hypothetical protein ABZ599_12010 [Streptomyces misionensis]|uniref:hypothetical protein n=1 Tax=Streptomyces misionensis TaxID=67331 RepID=UPI0033FD8CF1
MISDSIPWRVELLATAERLEKRKSQRRWTERTSFLIERDVMVGAYSVRRLKESYKVSDELAARAFTVQLHELSGSVPDVHNSHKFWDLYDLGASSDAELSLSEVCNQIIHSWVWGFAAGEDGRGLGGIFVSSDRKRRKCLYFLTIDMLIDLFRSIGEEDIYHIDMRRDENGEMHYTRIKGRPFASTGMGEFELPEGLK